MNEEKVINIGVVAHVDAGKTTLTEQLLYISGELRNKGSVDDGTAQTDWLSIERTRGISVKSSSVRITKGNCYINIIDTPGHADFNGEVERSLSVLDAAILIISAIEGIQAQTELLFEALYATKTPTIILINKIDRAGSDVEELINSIKAQFTPNILTFHNILKQGEKDCAISKKELIKTTFFEECVLTLSQFDNSLLEDYFSGKNLSLAHIENKLKTYINSAQIVPVLAASASLGLGVEDLLEFIIKFIEQSKNSQSNDLSAIVYKIEHDKTMGKIAHVRMFGGTIKNRDSIYIPSLEKSQKVTQIRRAFGGKYTDIGQVSTGDIAALCGLTDIAIGDVIGVKGKWSTYKLAVPFLKVKVIPQNISELIAVIAALGELCDEEPLLKMEYISEEKEIQMQTSGTIQLEVILALLKERYNLDVSFSPPSVIYKETPAKSGQGFEAYTMSKPCWAVVHLDIEPKARGTGVEYQSIVSNNDIFVRYQNHIETSVHDSLRQGLKGWEVIDLKVTLIGGQHHIVHTHPMDFFVATPVAVMDGLFRTGTNFLEPMINIRITAQEEFIGKIIGDIVQMRGTFDSPVIRKAMFTIEACVPVATSLDYPIRLGIISSGRANIISRYGGYKECLPELAAVTKRRGVNPLDHSKWILSKRNAIS